MTRPTNATKLTYEDFLLLPEDGNRHEVIYGEHCMTPAPATRHQRISMRLSGALFTFLEEHPLGEVFAAPIDIVLSETDIVEPDLVFIASARAEIVTEQNIQGAPDLVIEILSPGTRRRDELVKRKLYASFGVREYWIVDPDLDAVRVHRPSAQGDLARVAGQR